MARYTVVAYDLVSGQVLGDLPQARGASPTWEINQVGDLGGPTVGLAGLTDPQRQDVMDATTPWRRGLAVDRDGQVIWAGVITARRYSSDSRSFTLTVPGVMTYLQSVLITQNWVWGTPVEQFEIIRALVMAVPDPVVPIVVDSGGSGVTRQRTINGADLTPVLAEIEQISDNINGYEYAVRSHYASSGAGNTTPTIEHTLHLGSPELISMASVVEPVLLEHPGNVSSYSWDDDGDVLATDIWGATTTDEGVTLVGYGTNLRLLAAGYPRIMRSERWDGVSDPATLDQHIRQALAEAEAYGNTPTVTVPDDGDTAVGAWQVGDYVRLRISDTYRFTPGPGASPGVDVRLRIRSAALDTTTGTLSMTLAPPTQDIG